MYVISLLESGEREEGVSGYYSSQRTKSKFFIIKDKEMRGVKERYVPSYRCMMYVTVRTMKNELLEPLTSYNPVFHPDGRKGCQRNKR